MNQEKIGKFIAKCRSDKKFTQEELANKIGVTDKAISKWENGRCLPDVSLFKPLCNELNISLNELLSGEEDTKKNIDDGYINYIEYSKKKSNLKLLVITMVSFIVFVLMVLGIFFLNNYGKTTIYKLYGNSENFSYKEGVLTISSEKIVFNTGSLDAHNSLSTDDILSVKLMAKDEIININSMLFTSSLIIEDNGYNEIFTKEIIDNLDKWIIEIKYLKDEKIEEETIEVKNEQLIRNDNFFYKKVLPIGNDEGGKKEEEKNEFQSEPEKLRSKLIKDGFKQRDKEPNTTDAQMFFKLKKEIGGNIYYVDCSSRSIAIYSNTKNKYSFTGHYKDGEEYVWFTGVDNNNPLSWKLYVESKELTGCTENKCPTTIWEDSVDIYSTIEKILT